MRYHDIRETRLSADRGLARINARRRKPLQPRCQRPDELPTLGDKRIRRAGGKPPRRRIVLERAHRKTSRWM